MDLLLTGALLESTLDLLADTGVAGVNADAVTGRARAGKAAFYRRWPSVGHLIADALSTCALVPLVTDNGGMRADLVALLAPWGRPLDRCERAAGALLGHAGRDNQLDHVLERVVVQPLAATVEEILARQAARGGPTPHLRRALLVTVVQSLWWQRYASNSPPSTADDVAELVDCVLLPVTRSAPSRPEPGGPDHPVGR